MNNDPSQEAAADDLQREIDALVAGKADPAAAKSPSLRELASRGHQAWKQAQSTGEKAKGGDDHGNAKEDKEASP